MVNADSFTRVKNDINGNPRFVLHFLHFVKDDEVPRTAPDFVNKKYDLALKRAKAHPFYGRKFHNKQYGGGIVFCTYNLNGLIKDINELMESEAIA
jgi:hypothetical protein